MPESFSCHRVERLGQFIHKSDEPSYVDFVTEIETLWDVYFETGIGSSDAARLLELILRRMKAVIHYPERSKG